MKKVLHLVVLLFLFTSSIQNGHADACAYPGQNPSGYADPYTYYITSTASCCQEALASNLAACQVPLTSLSSGYYQPGFPEGTDYPGCVVSAGPCTDFGCPGANICSCQIVPYYSTAGISGPPGPWDNFLTVEVAGGTEGPGFDFGALCNPNSVQLSIANVQVSQAVNNFTLPGSPAQADLVLGKSTAFIFDLVASDGSTPDPTQLSVSVSDGTNTVSGMPVPVGNATSGVPGAITVTLDPPYIPSTAGALVLTLQASGGNYQPSDAYSSAYPSISVNVRVKQTNNLALLYVPFTCASSSNCPGQLQQNPPTTHIGNSTLFIQDTFPVADGGVTDQYTSAVGASKLPGWSGLVSDVASVQSKKLWTYNTYSRNGIGVVPQGYFGAHVADMQQTHGMTPRLTDAFRSSIGVVAANFFNPGASLVEEGWWTVTAHEVTHTFGIRDGDHDKISGYDVANNLSFVLTRLDYMLDNFYQDLSKTWIASESYGVIFQTLLTNPADPETILLGGVLKQDGTVSLGAMNYQPNGVATPYFGVTNNSVNLVGPGGDLLAQGSFAQANQLEFDTSDGQVFPVTDVPFSLQVPLNFNGWSFQVVSNGTVAATFYPTQLAVQAIQNIGTSTFLGTVNAAKKQAQLLSDATAADTLASTCGGAAACSNEIVQQLMAIRGEVNRVLNPFVTQDPSQLTKAAVLQAVDIAALMIVPKGTTGKKDGTFTFPALRQALAADFAASPPIYTSFDFPGASSTSPNSINQNGDIVGNYSDPSGNQHGFLLSGGIGGAGQSIDYPGASYTDVTCINNLGQMVGFYNLSNSTWAPHGFLLSAGVYKTIDYPNAQQTYWGGITDTGKIIGSVVEQDGTSHGVLLNNGKFTSISAPGSIATSTNMISGSRIVGDYTDSSSVLHGMLDTGGTFQTIDYPGSARSYLTGINAAGNMVGDYSFSSNGSLHGFLWKQGQYIPIDYPGSTSSGAIGINGKGTIVGPYTSPDGSTHGYLLQGE